MNRKILAASGILLSWGAMPLGAAAAGLAEVPQGDWSYEAVEHLEKGAILPPGAAAKLTASGNATRYEMAVAVSKAMENADKATLEQKALLKVLGDEYAQELNNMGVRVNVLEQKTNQLEKRLAGVEADAAAAKKKVERFQLNGYFGMRYDHWRNGPLNTGNVSNKMTELKAFLTYHLNPHMDVTVANTFNRSFLKETDDSTDIVPQQYIHGRWEKLDLLAGRFEYAPGFHMTFKDNIQGIRLETGNKLKVAAAWGKYAPSQYLQVKKADGTNNEVYTTNLYASLTDKAFHAFEVTYAASKATTIKGLFQTKPATNGDPTIGSGTRFGELGWESQLSDKFNLKAAMTRSNADVHKNSYAVQLRYGHVFPPIRGNYALYAGYYRVPANATIACTGLENSMVGEFFSTLGEGFRGPVLGVQYVPYDKILLTAFYMHGKTLDYCVVNQQPAGSAKNFFRLQCDFLFD